MLHEVLVSEERELTLLPALTSPRPVESRVHPYRGFYKRESVFSLLPGKGNDVYKHISDLYVLTIIMLSLFRRSLIVSMTSLKHKNLCSVINLLKQKPKKSPKLSAFTSSVPLCKLCWCEFFLQSWDEETFPHVPSGACALWQPVPPSMVPSRWKCSGAVSHICPPSCRAFERKFVSLCTHQILPSFSGCLYQASGNGRNMSKSRQFKGVIFLFFVQTYHIW